MQPWAEAQVAENQRNLHKNDPMVACMPPGVPRVDLGRQPGHAAPHEDRADAVAGGAPVPNLARTRRFARSSSTAAPFPRIRSRPGWAIRSATGRATRWSSRPPGSTADLDRTGSGHPQTEAARVTERFTRRDIGHMDIEITIDDPKAYMKPWRAKIPANLLPDSDLIETFCENERDIHSDGPGAQGG